MSSKKNSYLVIKLLILIVKECVINQCKQMFSTKYCLLNPFLTKCSECDLSSINQTSVFWEIHFTLKTHKEHFKVARGYGTIRWSLGYIYQQLFYQSWEALAGCTLSTVPGKPQACRGQTGTLRLPKGLEGTTCYTDQLWPEVSIPHSFRIHGGGGWHKVSPYCTAPFPLYSVYSKTQMWTNCFWTVD